LDKIFNLDRQIDLNVDVIKYYRSEKFMQPILEHQFTSLNSVVCKWQEDTAYSPSSLYDLSLEISNLPPLDSNPLSPAPMSTIHISTAYTDPIFSNPSDTMHVSMVNSINNKMTESQPIEERMIVKYEFDNSESFVIINSTTHETISTTHETISTTHDTISTTDNTPWCSVM